MRSSKRRTSRSTWRTTSWRKRLITSKTRFRNWRAGAMAIDQPTAEDKARDLEADLELVCGAADTQALVTQTEKAIGRTPYVCGALVDLGWKACSGWPAAIRRARAAEAEVERLTAENAT